MVACTRRNEAVSYAKTGGDKPRPYAAPSAARTQGWPAVGATLVVARARRDEAVRYARTGVTSPAPNDAG